MSANETRPVEKETLPIIHHTVHQQFSTCSNKYGPPCNIPNHSGSYEKFFSHLIEF